MAIAVGNQLLSTDMRSWYTRLNTIISKYGGGMATMTVPAAGKIAQTSDVNTVVTKLNAMKADAYLGAVPSMYTSYSVVSTGQIIRATTGLQLNTVISNLEAIKCRNLATNSNASKTNGNTNSLHGNGNSNSRNSNGNSNSRNSNGNSNSTNGNGNSNSSNGNGTHGNGGCMQGYCSYGQKTHEGNYYTNQCGYYCSNGTKSNGTKSNGNSNSRNGNGNSNSRNGNGDSNSRNSYGNSNSANQNGNAKTANTNGLHSNGTVIEIRNAQSTKSNGG